MKQLRIAARCAALCIIAFLSSPAIGYQWINSKVLLNGEDKGFFFYSITNSGKLLFLREDLLELGLKDIPVDVIVGKDNYVALSPRLSATFDKWSSVLLLMAAPEMLVKMPLADSSVLTQETNSLNVLLLLNDRNMGQHAITLIDDGNILIKHEDLVKLGIRVMSTVHGNSEDGLLPLFPSVRAELDRKSMTLKMTVAPELLTVVPESRSAGLDAQPEEMVIANVRMNDEDKGDFFIKRSQMGVIRFAKADFTRLGLKVAAESTDIAHDGYATLPPQVNARFDEKELNLYLTTSPDQLGSVTIDFSRERPNVDELIEERSSGFVNYGLSYNTDKNFDFTSLSMPLEAGVTTNGYLGVSSFSYHKTDDDERFVRLMSSIVKDLPAKERRIIAGDYSSSSGILGSGGLFGGLSIATKFSMDPYSLHYPGVNLYGAVNAPSDVSVYVNGLLVGREHLSPGEFEFTNIGNVQGSGDATMVIKDTTGREETITVPYYASSQLLRPGLQAYSYSLGYQREAYGIESAEYGDLAFLGSHRVGITRALTAGVRAEGDKDVANGGVSATFLLGTIGEFDVSYAHSREGEITGDAWSAYYSRSGRYVSGSLFARSYSREYANLMLGSADDKSRLEGSANIGFRQESLGSISLFYSKKDMYEDVDRVRYGINYNKRILPEVSFNVIAARTEAESTSDEIYANLMIFLGRSRSATLSYQKQDGSSAVRAGILKNAPIGTGYGYRVNAERSEDYQGETVSGGDAFLQYRGHHGIYSAEAQSVEGDNSYTVGTAGGIAFINSSAYFTRPIYDGFVLAKVGEFENVEVKYNNQPIGVTDDHGELLIPDLISYHRNNISINDKNIPVNYELSKIDQGVMVPYRAGGIVRFDAKKVQAFTGQLLLRERGKSWPAEYWGLQIRNASDAREIIVGKYGEFYLENLQAGKFSARLFRDSEACNFELVIPDSNAIMVDLGKVTCERN